MRWMIWVAAGAVLAAMLGGCSGESESNGVSSGVSGASGIAGLGGGGTAGGTGASAGSSGSVGGSGHGGASDGGSAGTAGAANQGGGVHQGGGGIGGVGGGGAGAGGTVNCTASPNCFECCQQAYPDGYDRLYELLAECGCGTEENPGPCATDCRDLCSGAATEPDPYCVDCMGAELTEGGQCYGPVIQTCMREAVCMAFGMCAYGCQ